MANRPKRTFRPRRADSSDSDSAQETSAEPGATGEQAARDPAVEGPPSGRGHAEVAELLRRGRGRRRGRAWASSRHAARAAPRLDESSDVPESRMVDLSADEEDGAHHSSESKDDQSSSPNSSRTLEDEFSSVVNIPDAAVMQATYRKCKLARAQEDYISLDVKHTFTNSGMKKNSEDSESEPDDFKDIMPFTPKPQTLRQRMAEETTTRNEETSDDSQDEKTQDIWEQQQMRKAVKITKGQDIDLSYSHESQTVKKFDASISFPPVSLEIIKKKLNTRLTLLQDTHRSHLREYEKYIQDIKSSKSTIQNLENSSNQTLSFKFYKSMKIYVENLIDCLNEKIISIQEIESAMHALLLKQAMIFMKRRQDELKHESAYLQQLSCKPETSINKSLAMDEKTQWILEEAESRRARRRQARILSGNCTHEEGTSSDDELSSADMIDFQKSQGFVEFIWDPLSTTQTTSLVTQCRMILEEHSTCENEVNKGKQDLLKSIVSRMKKAIEDDVFIPLYPKSAVENRTSPHSKFQERQFWSGLKLFGNILLWNELLPEDTLQELGLGKLLNRYLIIALLNAIPGPDVVKKCSQIAAYLPEKWFQNSAMRTSIPQLENFIQFLLQSARKLSRNEIRDEVKEIILILVKIKALNQAESFIEECHLDHLRSVIKEFE
ncbi:PREDICTED: GC-rich sequence DNA-binding factor 2 isoform X4 [Bison bison bison]|uniref:GC-rich sequence DNA-binding factor 2 isoform X4 n=1 Tax=Bison bison bison TaxID=43346 RepID=A0A6P3JB23_BISBB|nr:PREDICTED: GC-rich sequence DNA-binding factor 2 isoform X4 [Bison bison bison]